MALSAPTVTVYLDLPADGGNYFVIGDPVKGVIGSTTYLIAGDIGTDLTGAAYDITIRRGRSSELDDITPGTCEIAFRNHDRDFDGLNTAGPYYGYLKPGRPMKVAIYGRTIFAGDVDDWQLTYTPDLDATAIVPCVDGLGLLARREFDLWTTTAGQTAGPRVTAVLNRSEVGWPGGQRDIGTGVSTLQADTVSWGSNVLNYLQLVAQSDLGVVFCDRENVLTFRDRHSLTNPTPLLTFADDGADVPLHGGGLGSSGERFFNRVGVDREGGTLQTASDAASIAQDGARSLSRSGLLLDSDAQSASMANFLLNTYRDPEPRVRTITVNVSALDPAIQPQVAALDIYDVVAVRWTPRGTGSQIVETMSIEGIDHTIPFDAPHLMTFALAPITQSSVFVIGDAVLGVIGGIGRIAF